MRPTPGQWRGVTAQTHPLLGHELSHAPLPDGLQLWVRLWCCQAAGVEGAANTGERAVAVCACGCARVERVTTHHAAGACSWAEPEGVRLVMLMCAVVVAFHNPALDHSTPTHSNRHERPSDQDKFVGCCAAQTPWQGE